jgi:hypothetical protein
MHVELGGLVDRVDHCRYGVVVRVKIVRMKERGDDHAWLKR